MISRNTLEGVILTQDKNLSKIDRGIKREKRINPINSFVTIITGIRRSGKSTLMQQVMDKYKTAYYLNLEDPRLDGFDVSDFITSDDLMHERYGSKGVYFFDEIQNVDKWEKYIRSLTDKKEKVVVTGSNASMLSRELGTRLTGRHLNVELFPFSYVEYLKLKKEKEGIKSFGSFFLDGGFPEYLKTKNSLILNELFSDIVIKDIAVRFGIRNVDVLRKLATYLLSNVGKEYSYNSLKNQFNIKSVQTVIDYISFFEDAYLFFTVPRFDYSLKKQQIAPKKIYAIDQGFIRANSKSFSQDHGRILENIVFLHLRRKYKDIFYFKQNNLECDFVVKDKDKLIYPIQVCYDFNKENEQREINGLLDAMKKLKLNKGLILTNNTTDKYTINKKVIDVIPVWSWLVDKK